MNLEKLFRFLEIYINRKRIKRIVHKLDKLPLRISKAGLPEHEKIKLEKTFKLIVLQLFKPKTKKEKRNYLKS